jgi:Na+/proline symporter
VLTLVTLLPAAIIILAIYSQVVDAGWRSIWISAAFIGAGVIVYFITKKYVKQRNNIPDIDPWVLEEPASLKPVQ